MANDYAEKQFRQSCLSMALDLARHHPEEATPDKIVANAAKFYAFIDGPTSAPIAQAA